MGLRQSLAFLVLVVLAHSSVAVSVAAEAGNAVAVPTVAEETALSADAINDPWLSEEGPAVAKPVEIPRERVATTWQDSLPTAHARAAALLRTRLEYGLGDLPAAAAVVASEASLDDPALHSALARDLAPGVPSFQLDHVFAQWRGGDIGGGIGSLGSAMVSVSVSLAAQLWLLENFSLLLLAVVLSASMCFVLLAAVQVFPHAAHDLGDLLSGKTPAFARFAALSALVLVPLVFGEGLLGFVVALFAVGFVYGGSRQRNALAMAAVLLVIGLHPLARVASVATHLVERDPVAHSVMAVLAGSETTADVELLQGASLEDLAAEHALAYRARRYGLEELSRERMDSIAARYPSDVVALTNLGNVEKRRGNHQAAIEFYERAATHANSPTLLFNLSQAYASVFRMDEYEATLLRAQHLGNAEVAALSDQGEGELVADLGYPIGMLRDRLLTLALSEKPQSSVMTALAPGRLGEAWFMTAGAFALIALFAMLLGSRWDHSSQCGRCGHRICTRCEDTVWSDEICEDCHHLFQNPDATDPSLRMARLQALSVRETFFDRIWLGLSLLVPGMAGFAARRPDFAMLGLLLFCWVATWIAWPSGILADPMLMGSAALLSFAIPGLFAAFAYAGVVLVSLIVRKSR